MTLPQTTTCNTGLLQDSSPHARRLEGLNRCGRTIRAAGWLRDPLVDFAVHDGVEHSFAVAESAIDGVRVVLHVRHADARRAVHSLDDVLEILVELVGVRGSFDHWGWFLTFRWGAKRKERAVM